MTSENPICPVCGNALKATGVDPNMYYCIKRKIWVSDLGIHLDIVDATVSITPEGKINWQLIEIPPYSFLITDDAKGQQTVVRKVLAPESKPYYKARAKTYERKIVLTVPALMKLPWNNKEEVLNRMKLYLLFS